MLMMIFLLGVIKPIVIDISEMDMIKYSFNLTNETCHWSTGCYLLCGQRMSLCTYFTYYVHLFTYCGITWWAQLYVLHRMTPIIPATMCISMMSTMTMNFNADHFIRVLWSFVDGAHISSTLIQSCSRHVSSRTQWQCMYVVSELQHSWIVQFLDQHHQKTTGTIFCRHNQRTTAGGTVGCEDNAADGPYNDIVGLKHFQCVYAIVFVFDFFKFSIVFDFCVLVFDH